MPYYVKITKKVREAILPAYIVVRRTFDGNYLVYQSALERVEGNTLSERCENVGGALLTPLEAKQEIAGTSCKSCHTPEAYGGNDTNGVLSPGSGPGTDNGIDAGADSNTGADAGNDPEVPAPGSSDHADTGTKKTAGSGEEKSEETENKTDKKESEVTDEQK